MFIPQICKDCASKVGGALLKPITTIFSLLYEIAMCNECGRVIENDEECYDVEEYEQAKSEWWKKDEFNVPKILRTPTHELEENQPSEQPTRDSQHSLIVESPQEQNTFIDMNQSAPEFETSYNLDISYDVGSSFDIGFTGGDGSGDGGPQGSGEGGSQ